MNRPDRSIMPAHQPWRRIVGALGAVPPATMFILCLALVALFGTIDVLTQNELLFSVFYLLPIMLAAWFTGWRRGLIISFLSVAMLFLDDLDSSRASLGSVILYWDALGRLSFFGIIAYTLSSLKNVLAYEQELARTDSLTGAANGRAFRELAEREMSRARRYAEPLTLAYLDIDDFKRINDAAGHAAGDQLLQASVRVLVESVREIDIVARVGGDEFVILLPRAGFDEAGGIVRRIRENLRNAALPGIPPATFSMGVTTYEEGIRSIDEMVRAADALMYRVKRNGKNNLLHERVSRGEARTS